MTPAFAEYPQTLDDAALMPSHAKARGEGVRAGPSLEFYRVAGLSVLHVFEETIFARVEEWYRLPTRITTDLPAHQRLDNAVTTPGEESVRRALAIQLIITREWGAGDEREPAAGLLRR